MANADDYANWIVKNEGKKGTPEFETVVAAYKQAKAEDTPAPQERGWGDVAASAVTNVPSSAINYAKGLASSVLHPIDTATNLVRLGQGAVVNATPQPMLDVINRINPGNAQRRQEVSNLASQVGQQYAADYGSVAGLKNKIATDPVGTLGDVSALLSLGGGAMAKAPALSKISAPIKKAGDIANPVNLVAKPVAAAGNATAELLSAVGTHTGSMPIKQAFKSGMEGGKSSTAFRENMRGNANMEEIVNAAKENVANMGKAKAAEYRAGMAQVSGDKTVLDMSGIKQALQDAKSSVSFGGQMKNKKAGMVLGEIEKEINRWEKLPPAVYHTPEGLDALKQRIGGIIENQPFEQKTARMAANGVYHAIKGEIVKQAPVYAETMRKYSDAMTEIKEIERTLSIGNKPSVDTAMRKLQSLTRNNVNTNYGNRLGLAKTLEQKGGNELLPALAGQALNNFAPRGLGGTVAGGVGMGGYAMGGPDLAAALLALQSPRLIGESAYKLGQAGRIANLPLKGIARTGLDPATVANILAQGGLLGQQ